MYVDFCQQQNSTSFGYINFDLLQAILIQKELKLSHSEDV